MNTTIRKALIAGGLTLAALAGGAIGGPMLNGVATAQTSDATTPAAPANSDDDRPKRGPRAELTAENASKAIAAAKAGVADATPHGVHSGPDGGYVVGAQKADGSHVRIHLDSSFKVTEVKEGRGPGRHRHGPRGPRPDKTTATTTPAA